MSELSETNNNSDEKIIMSAQCRSIVRGTSNACVRACVCVCVLNLT